MKHLHFLSCVLAFLGFAGCQPSAPEAAPPEVTPTVAVATVELEEGIIAATIKAYGNVSVLQKELEVVSAQYESLVSRLIVSAGEPVEPGDSLIEIAPSPDALLQFNEAESAASSAAAQLSNVQKRFKLKLAVNEELDQAAQIARESEARLESLRKRGQGEARTLKSAESGIVNDIGVSIGQVVPAGTPLLSIVPRNHIEIRLGVEPEDAASFTRGAGVKLFSVNRENLQSEGTVRLVTKRINPQTRLIDTYVSVPPGSPLLLESYVRAEIRGAEKTGLVVPREAVISGEGGPRVFTVRDGKAVEHRVATGIETETQTEIIAQSLKPGDEIVTVGNSQLSDGMAVTIK